MTLPLSWNRIDRLPGRDYLPAALVTGGIAMKKRPLILKIIAIVNALLITIAFVGCPGRNNQGILPAPIAPPPIRFTDQPPPPPPFVTIAPYGGNFQQVLPMNQAPQVPSQDAKQR
jgi:hypothetical protein